MTQKTYRSGKRLSRTQGMFHVIITVEVAFFYLVYLYILAESYPNLAGSFLLAVFFAIEAALMILVKVGFRRARDRFACTVTESGLKIVGFFGEQELSWADFKSMTVNNFAGRNPCPVTFTLQDGRRFMPNQYLNDLAGLCSDIYHHIKDTAEIQENMEEKLNTFKILGI